MKILKNMIGAAPQMKTKDDPRHRVVPRAFRRVRRSDLTPHGLKSAAIRSAFDVLREVPRTAVQTGVSLETRRNAPADFFARANGQGQGPSSSKAPLSPTGLPKHNWQLSRPSRPSRRAHDIKSQSQSSQRSCQIIIHMRTRVGQIATARATQSAARRNLRLSPRTAHALLHVATGISPVSRRVSSFPSPSGRRCTAAGARSHSPCGP